MCEVSVKRGRRGEEDGYCLFSPAVLAGLFSGGRPAWLGLNAYTKSHRKQPANEMNELAAAKANCRNIYLNMPRRHDWKRLNVASM